MPDARHMAVGTQGIAVFVGTRKDKVWVVTDRDKDRVADEVKSFAPSITKAIPNGVCFSKDGFLYIAEQNRVLVSRPPSSSTRARTSPLARSSRRAS